VPLAVSREGEARANVFRREFRKILDDFRFGHSGGEITQHIRNRQAKPANARLPTTLTRLDGDDLAVVHDAVHVSFRHAGNKLVCTSSTL
jgi:hypothetical protein